MPHPVHLVLSIPPEGVAEDEYSSWYDTHVAEILETPGFVAARRYWLAPAVPGRPPVEYRHLVVYVMDRPSEAPLDDLGRRGRAGEMTMPDWFGEIRFASFDGRPLEDEELDLPDHAYLVFSHAPRRFTTEEYYGWYYAHARENLTSDGLDTVWRYGLTPVPVVRRASRRLTCVELGAGTTTRLSAFRQHGAPSRRSSPLLARHAPSIHDPHRDAPFDPDRLGKATHAAFYKVDRELPALRRALQESIDARRVDIPDWLPEGDFVSFDCLSATAR